MHARIRQALTITPGIVAVLLVARLARIWVGRLPYRYDLEWMEGGMLSHSWRMLQGLPTYPEPGPDFVPYIYPPAYAAVVAAIGSVIGLSPGLGRAVALAGTLAAAGALVHAMRRWGATPLVAACVAAVFLGTYPTSGAFFDLVRPDGLTIALLGWSVALTVDGRRGTPLAAGLLLAAAFLTKHNTAVFGPALLLAHLWRSRRDGGVFLLSSALPSVFAALTLHWRSGGHFLVYLLQVPASHPSFFDRFFPGTFFEIGGALPVATAIIALLALGRELHASRWPPAATAPLSVLLGIGVGMACTMQPSASKHTGPGGLFGFAVGLMVIALILRIVRVRRAPLALQGTLVATLLATAFVTCGMMRAHNGGYLNVLIPLLWCGTLAFGFVLTQIDQRAAAAVLAAQLLWAHVGIDARTYLPTAADTAAGDQLVAALVDRPGPVLAPYSAWLPTYAGHAPSVHYMALWDLDYRGNPYRGRLDDVRDAVKRHHWPTALQSSHAFPYGLAQAYRLDGDALEEPPMPKTGWKAGPKGVMKPR